MAISNRKRIAKEAASPLPSLRSTTLWLLPRFTAIEKPPMPKLQGRRRCSFGHTISD
ncbi:hypothetical protein [Brasilonema sp. UFV-L1]|uniref:hypothetical protein n=1 Tax=Brasilonema sp. UFV-L1 TaxID=2234130 RepID=UPI00145F9FBD|nr:hypothetical protein [Brasilonema sp. UFV-L1]